MSVVAELKAGRELDALVAVKIFGWIKERYADYPANSVRATANCWHRPGKDAPCSLPEFSTDIAAAMPVLDRFAFGIQKVTEVAMYVVDIWTADGKEFLCDGISASLPEAICLAALRAVESHR